MASSPIADDTQSYPTNIAHNTVVTLAEKSRKSAPFRTNIAKKYDDVPLKHNANVAMVNGKNVATIPRSPSPSSSLTPSTLVNQSKIQSAIPLPSPATQKARMTLLITTPTAIRPCMPTSVINVSEDKSRPRQTFPTRPA